MKLRNFLKSSSFKKSTRHKFVIKPALLYGLLFFGLVAVIIFRFSNSNDNAGVGLTRLEFYLSPLLYLVPMTIISAFLSVVFIRKFSLLYVSKNHTHRARLIYLLENKQFEKGSELMRKSNDAVIMKYSKELIKAIASPGVKKIRIKDLNIDNTCWGNGRAGLVSIGILFTFIGVYRVMQSLGESATPVMRDLFSGAGQALLSTIVGAGFGGLTLIYFFVLTMLQHRATEIEKGFLNNIGMEVDSYV